VVAAAQALTMKTRWLLNIGLALLVGVLVLIAVYKPGAKQEEATGAPLTMLAPEAITRIRLLRPKQAEIVLTKSGDDWRVSAPRAARANGFRIGALTRLADTRVKTAFPAKPAELGQYGLDRPVATLFLNDAEIRFGGLHPLANELYVLHADRVQLVPADVLRTASAPLEELLSPNLLEDQLKIVALRFPGFALKQNAQGAWTRTPEMKELSSDRLNRFVDEWRYARALSVAADSGKPARERVLLTIADGDQSRTLEFGVRARHPELVLVRADEKLAYHFPADAVGRLLELRPEPEAPAAPPGVPAAK
jgi:hypothetical protein